MPSSPSKSDLNVAVSFAQMLREELTEITNLRQKRQWKNRRDSSDARKADASCESPSEDKAHEEEQFVRLVRRTRSPRASGRPSRTLKSAPTGYSCKPVRFFMVLVADSQSCRPIVRGGSRVAWASVFLLPLIVALPSQ